MVKGMVITTEEKIEERDFEEPLQQSLGKALGGYARRMDVERLAKPFCLFLRETGKNTGLFGKEQGRDAFEEGVELNRIGSQLCKMDVWGAIIILREGFFKGEPDIAGLDEEDIFRLKTLMKNAFMRHWK